MANETLKVKALSKYGVQDETGAYINWSKTIKESEKGKIVPGGEYIVDMFRAESGKGYINRVLDTKVAEMPKLVAPVFNNTPLAKTVGIDGTKLLMAKTHASESMSKADWSAKDRSMMIGGISHDASQLVHASFVANVPLDDVLNAYRKALSTVLEIREEVR